MAVDGAAATGASASTATAPPPFAAVRAHLIFFALVDQLHTLFKKKSATPAAATTAPGSTEVSLAHKPDADWILAMRHLFSHDDKKAVEKMETDWLGQYNDMAAAVDLDELADVANILDVCLSSAPSAGEWLASLWTAPSVQ